MPAQAWGQQVTLEQALDQIQQKRLVILGEAHGNKHVVELQTQIQQRLAEKDGKLNIVMEHFSLEMQPLLDDYLAS